MNNQTKSFLFFFWVSSLIGLSLNIIFKLLKIGLPIVKLLFEIFILFSMFLNTNLELEKYILLIIELWLFNFLLTLCLFKFIFFYLLTDQYLNF